MALITREQDKIDNRDVNTHHFSECQNITARQPSRLGPPDNPGRCTASGTAGGHAGAIALTHYA